MVRVKLNQSKKKSRLSLPQHQNTYPRGLESASIEIPAFIPKLTWYKSKCLQIQEMQKFYRPNCTDPTAHTRLFRPKFTDQTLKTKLYRPDFTSNFTDLSTLVFRALKWPKHSLNLTTIFMPPWWENWKNMEKKNHEGFYPTFSVLRCTWTGWINLKIFLGYHIKYLNI